MRIRGYWQDNSVAKSDVPSPLQYAPSLGALYGDRPPQWQNAGPPSRGVSLAHAGKDKTRWRIAARGAEYLRLGAERKQILAQSSAIDRTLEWKALRSCAPVRTMLLNFRH